MRPRGGCQILVPRGTGALRLAKFHMSVLKWRVISHEEDCEILMQQSFLKSRPMVGEEAEVGLGGGGEGREVSLLPRQSSSLVSFRDSEETEWIYRWCSSKRKKVQVSKSRVWSNLVDEMKMGDIEIVNHGTWQLIKDQFTPFPTFWNRASNAF